MRVGNLVSIAAGKIHRNLLPGVVALALIVPTINANFGQSAAGTVQQVPLFTVIGLTANGYNDTHASGISGGQQVGYGADQATGGGDHALLWRGASGVIDLNPNEYMLSVATATCGGEQVGYGYGQSTGRSDHALLWHGSAGSVVDLHPNGFIYSRAQGTSGGQQVGEGRLTLSQSRGNKIVPGVTHALFWRGSVASVVDLHPRGFISSEARGTDGEEQIGIGSLSHESEWPRHALLWRGSAGSVVDLNPRGFEDSEALGASNGEQVGWGIPIGGAYPGGPIHALLWRGSADSVVDLHPRGFLLSEAHATNGGEQVGWGNGHALLWHGSAGSVVDLHTFLPSGFERSAASGIDANGNIVGTASGSGFNNSHAVMWKRNVATPSARRGKNTARCQNSP